VLGAYAAAKAFVEAVNREKIANPPPAQKPDEAPIDYVAVVLPSIAGLA
jgi:hypothetical protein